jgi:hypothetical protein
MADIEVRAGDGLCRRAGAAVYVVCRVDGDRGPFAVCHDGTVRRMGEGWYVYACSCGALADTRGHFTSRAEARRRAVALNRSGGQDADAADHCLATRSGLAARGY